MRLAAHFAAVLMLALAPSAFALDSGGGMGSTRPPAQVSTGYNATTAHGGLGVATSGISSTGMRTSRLGTTNRTDSISNFTNDVAMANLRNKGGNSDTNLRGQRVPFTQMQGKRTYGSVGGLGI